MNRVAFVGVLAALIMLGLFVAHSIPQTERSHSDASSPTHIDSQTVPSKAKDPTPSQFTGVIGPNGCSSVGCEGNWSIGFSYLAYCIENGEVLPQEISVSMGVTDAQQRDFHSRLNKYALRDEYAIVTIKGIKTSQEGDERIEMTELLSIEAGHSKFAEIIAKHRKGVEEDTAKTITGTFTGVVEPGGCAGVGGKGNWHLVFSFVAYCIEDGELIRREIPVTMKLPDNQYREYSSKLKEYTIATITGRRTTRKGEDRIEMTQLVGVRGSHSKFDAFIINHRKPVIIQDKLFGKLILNRKVNWFEGKAQWNGQQVEVTFPADDNGSIGEALETAKLMWPKRKEWKDKIDDYAVKKLLDLKNGIWLGQGEKPVTPAQFKSRMKLESITFGADGEFEFWHKDGGLFFGHSIQISGSIEEGPTDADIPG